MAEENAPNRPLVFSIDDDDSMNVLMDARFKRFGCEIVTFSNPHQLIDALKRKIPRLLVLDIHLDSDFDGFYIIDFIRNTMKLSFPIIVLSSDSESQRVSHALEMGANDFLVKPALRLDFEEKISEYLQASGIPKADKPVFSVVPQGLGDATIHFSLEIAEVMPHGFSLRSTHLIKKGSSFWLSGKSLGVVISSREEVLVTVAETTMSSSEENRYYKILVHIDPSDELVVKDIQLFLRDAKRKQLQREGQDG